MSVEQVELRFEAAEKPIVVRFERLLRKLFRLQAELLEVRAKNLKALGREEEL